MDLNKTGLYIALFSTAHTEYRMHLLNIILALSGLYLFFIAAVAAGKKLTLRDRVAALETLFRTEMYLLQEKVKQIQEETNYYIKSLNETIENVGAYGSGLGSIQSEDELKSETRDLKLVSVEFDEIKQKFEYLRKGVAKEKKARKENSRILMTRIEQTEEKHISLSMAFERFKNASNSDATKRKEEFNDHLKEYEQLKKKVVEKERKFIGASTRYMCIYLSHMRATNAHMSMRIRTVLLEPLVLS